MRRTLRLLLIPILFACSGPGGEAPTSSASAAITSSTSSTTSTIMVASTTTVPPTTTTTLPRGVTPPPVWLGTRPLPLDDEGNAPAQPTPPEMIDRRFTSPDLLPPPTDDAYHFSISDVPAEVVARSTWVPECPVGLEGLAYLTMAFWGFDQRPHTGEMVVNADVADDVVDVFARLHEARFPIEVMRITTPEDLEAHPTGDGNITESFVCRPVTGGSGWSQHAYGLAIDINPFHNPYRRGEVVLPELATAYLDRTRGLPGMIVEGDVVTSAFDDIGWGWGGRWSSLDDWQHFSRNGR